MTELIIPERVRFYKLDKPVPLVLSADTYYLTTEDNVLLRDENWALGTLGSDPQPGSHAEITTDFLSPGTKIMPLPKPGLQYAHSDRYDPERTPTILVARLFTGEVLVEIAKKQHVQQVAFDVFKQRILEEMQADIDRYTLQRQAEADEDIGGLSQPPTLEDMLVGHSDTGHEN